MPYDPKVHHRRSLRLPGYDYASPGAYYVTLRNEGKLCVWGAVIGDELRHNEAGRMVLRWLSEVPHKFPYVSVDEHVVMPNHVHVIFFIHTGARVRLSRMPRETAEGQAGVLRPALGRVVGWLKTMSTNEYIRGVKEKDWPPFPGRLWQRNYYERILDSQKQLDAARVYIARNPANWHQDRNNLDGE